MIRLAAEDLKTYYLEAASAQPGGAGPRQLSDWFWRETRAADTLRRMKIRCRDSDDDALKIVGAMLLVPYNQAT